MKNNKVLILLAVAALLFSVLACGGNFSTANIDNAWTATDQDGNNATEVFSQDAVFYAMVDLKNAPDDTKLKAIWTAVDAADTEANLLINETETTSSDALIHFQLGNDYLWPIGQYKVEIYLNDALDKTLNFEVR